MVGIAGAWVGRVTKFVTRLWALTTQQFVETDPVSPEQPAGNFNTCQCLFRAVLNKVQSATTVIRAFRWLWTVKIQITEQRNSL